MHKPFAALPTLLFAVLIVALTATGPVHAQGAVDKKLGKTLDKQKLAFEVDADGDYKLTFDVGAGRSQVVWIRSGVSAYGDLVLREILSIGAVAPGGAVPAVLSDRMLTANAESKLGAWAKNAGHAVFVAKVPADLEGKRLAAALELVARSADELEREMGGADAF